MVVRNRALAVGLLVAGLLVVAPSAAGASGESVGECFAEAFEEIEAAFAAGEITEAEFDEQSEAAADECIEAPSPILPEVNELIWGAIFFAVLFAVLAKFAFPALRSSMAAREERIRSDLDSAEQSRVDAEAELARYREQLAASREEAAQIVDEARQAADQVRRDIVARAEAEAAELRARADEDVRLATERALTELQGRVGELAVDLAEKIVERSLDRDTQMALVESYISELGTRTN